MGNINPIFIYNNETIQSKSVKSNKHGGFDKINRIVSLLYMKKMQKNQFFLKKCIDKIKKWVLNGIIKS